MNAALKPGQVVNAAIHLPCHDQSVTRANQRKEHQFPVDDRSIRRRETGWDVSPGHVQGVVGPLGPRSRFKAPQVRIAP